MDMTPTPDEIARARDRYFSRAYFQDVFDRLPRVGEIFESIEAKRTERIAALHLHAAFTSVNLTNFMMAASTAMGTEALGKSLIKNMLMFNVMAVDLDPAHLEALVKALQADGADFVAKIARGG